jgi:hypothetical protein
MASQGRKDAALDLMIRARGILNVDDDAVVSVSEHDCGDPECRGARTVILIMRPDQPTKAIKINKPLEAVGGRSLRRACAFSLRERRAQGAIADEVMVSRMSSSSSTPA